MRNEALDVRSEVIRSLQKEVIALQHGRPLMQDQMQEMGLGPRTFKKGIDYCKALSIKASGQNIDKIYYPFESTIYLSWSVNGKYHKQSTGQRIKPAEWDFELKLPFMKHRNYLELSVLLKKIKSNCEREYISMKINEITITSESIKNMVRRIVLITPNDLIPFWSAYDEFLQDKSLITKPATIVKYESTRKAMKKFE